MGARKQAITDHQPLISQSVDTSRAGTMVKIRGERGTLKVHEEVRTDAGKEWVTLFKANQGFRHVRPDRIIWPVIKKPRKKET